MDRWSDDDGDIGGRFRNGDGGIGVTDIDFAGDEHDGDVRDGGNADFVGG